MLPSYLISLARTEAVLLYKSYVIVMCCEAENDVDEMMSVFV